MINRLGEVDRRGIDAAIESAIARLQARAAGRDDAFTLLTDAVARTLRGGKRFRPALVVASFRGAGGPEGDASAYRVAAAFELLHAAFVVHDDVIDHDLERRGVLNIAGEFRVRGTGLGASDHASAGLGTAAAILGGDLLLYEATRLIATIDMTHERREALLALFDDAVIVTAAGELADVDNAAATTGAGAAALLETAHDKTAVYSFAAPLCAGSVLAGADADTVRVLRSCGGNLGLAFQLVDDLIGAFGTSAQAGREPGVDLREAKRTPLIAFAEATPSWQHVSDALAVAHTGPVAVLEAQRVLGESGARARLEAHIDRTLAAARDAAVTLPEPQRRLIADIATRIEERIP